MLMLKGNKYRTGIDDRPMTSAEFDCVRDGGMLYEHVTAPERPKNEPHQGTNEMLTQDELNY